MDTVLDEHTQKLTHTYTHLHITVCSLERLGLQTVLNIPANENLHVGAQRVLPPHHMSSS